MNDLKNRQRLEYFLKKGRVREALAFLNSLTPFRFSAVFFFKGAWMQNRQFIDRENPNAPLMPDLEITASYCVFPRDTGRPFSTPDSIEDPLLVTHPLRLKVRSYCGIPLVDENGDVFGTVCHFDYEPSAAPDAVIRSVHSLECFGRILNQYSCHDEEPLVDRRRNCHKR